MGMSMTLEMQKKIQQMIQPKELKPCWCRFGHRKGPADHEKVQLFDFKVP